MHDPLRMRCVESVSNLDGQVQHFVRFKWLASNAILEGLPFE